MKQQITLLLLLLVTSLTAQNVIRGPYLQSGGSSSIIVKWRTDTPTNSQVWIGTTPNQLDTPIFDDKVVTDHEVFVGGLTPNTTYFYAVGTTYNQLAGADAAHYFTTAPNVGSTQPVKAWVLGDCGTGNQDARKVRDAYYNYMGNDKTDMILMLGDNAYPDGSDWDFQKAIFDNMYEEMLVRAPMWSCIGNHELHTSNSQNQTGAYYDIYSFPTNGEIGGLASGTEAYYSFDYANIHFLILDSQGSGRNPGDPMMVWLENDLNLTNQDWIVVLFHHPPYSKGSHDSDAEAGLAKMRENVLPILEAGGVDLVLSGHSHSYERSYLINGHYSHSYALQPQMILNNGDGRTNGNGAYGKSKVGPNQGKGAVYITAGSSGKKSGGALNHPVMYYSEAALGSLSLEIQGSQLDLKFIDDNGVVKDYFTIIKSGLPSGIAPTVNLVNPSGSQSYLDNEIVEFEAFAQDADGSVTKVAFYINNEYFTTDYEAPYKLEWTANQLGSFNIQARANDDQGNITFSNSIEILVEQAPSVIGFSSCPEDITIECAEGTTGAIVNWETPTFFTDCSLEVLDCGNSDIPETIFLGEWNNSKYFVHKQGLNWHEAQAFATQNGGHLAIINSQEENDFIQSIITQNQVWIGASDESVEGQFKWVNGTPTSYENWGPWQPSNSSGTEHFVYLSKNDGTWFDANNFKQAFVIELPCAGVNLTSDGLQITQISGMENGGFFQQGTTNITYRAIDGCGGEVTCSFVVNVLPCDGGTITPCTETALPDFTWLASSDQTIYYLSNTVERWETAASICQSMGGELASINSETENDLIQSALVGFNDFPLIGINDLAIENVFTWADGSPILYDNLADQMNNDQSNDFGIFNPWTGNWELVNEWVHKPFILAIPCLTGDTAGKNRSADVIVNHSEKLSRSTLELYPNPMRDQLQVQLNIEAVNEESKTAILRIVSMDGTFIQQEPLSVDFGQYRRSLELAHLHSGIYLLQIILDDKVFEERFVKM